MRCIPPTAPRLTTGSAPLLLLPAPRTQTFGQVRYVEDTTFKVSVSAFQATLSDPQKVDIIEDLKYMDFKGRIRMRDPELEVIVWQEHFDGAGSSIGGPLRRVWLGKMVSQKCAQKVVDADEAPDMRGAETSC